MARVRRVVLWAVAGLFGLYCLGLFLSAKPALWGWVDELVPVIVPSVSAVLCFYVARRRGGLMWWLLGAGAAAWAAGDVGYTVLDRLGIDPQGLLTWADGLYLALVPLWCFALINHPVRGHRRFEQAGTGIDAAAVIVGLGGVAWAFVFSPLVQDATNFAGAITAIAYPLGDLALLTAFAAVVARAGGRFRRCDVLLGGAIVTFALADLIYSRLALSFEYQTGSPVDLLFELGFIGVGAAALCAVRAPRAEATEPRAGALTGITTLALLAVVAFVGLVTRNQVVIAAGLLMGVLIGVRQTLMLVDRRRLMDHLEEESERAEKANLAKTQFLSHMSHELGTPLSSILGYAQLLEEKGQRDEERLYAARIRRAGEHLHDVVRDALDISRIEQGRLGMSLEPVSLHDLAIECLDVIGPNAESSAVEVRLDGDVDREIIVLADRQRLKQVLLNLLSNGVKYNSEHGMLTLRWDRIDGGRIRIAVTDTGLGIAPEALDRLFTPFERLGSAAGVQGTGLGLALSKRMVEAMSGEIGVASTIGRGSTFWISVPTTKMPERNRTPERPNGSARIAGDVLYIEDNAANIRLVEDLLAAHDVTLRSALSATEGLRMAKKQIPDLILLDRHLPDSSAEDVLVQLKRSPNTSSVPVVVLSADASPGLGEKLLLAGAYAYITKPIDVDRFVVLLTNALAA